MGDEAVFGGLYMRFSKWFSASGSYLNYNAASNERCDDDSNWVARGISVDGVSGSDGG